MISIHEPGEEAKNSFLMGYNDLIGVDFAGLTVPAVRLIVLGAISC